MDRARIGDIITRSDNQKYIIIDDGFPIASISPDILQLPASSMLAKNLLGSRIGDNFNFNNRLTIKDISHSNYLEEINKKKKAIAEENQTKREITNTTNTLDAFNFQLTENLHRQRNIAVFNSQKQRENDERNEKERRKRNSYKNIIAKRDIRELIHFTNISNIKTIIEYGILPRKEVECKLPTTSVNDIYRYDNYKNATCLSVSFPNYKMFYKYQNENKNAHWAVISLNPELLTDLDIKYFLFFKENAAKNDSSICTFTEMFGNSNGCDPENPQAEILAFGTIPPKYIQKIYVRTLEDKTNLERAIWQNINIEVNTKYFTYRKGDYS